MANLLDDVSFEVKLRPDEIRPDLDFPPKRFSLRDERFTALNNLWRGDFSEYDIKYEVAVNYFNSYSTKLANLLLMSEPKVGNLNFSNPMYDAVIDMTRYGGSILRWDGEELSALDPMLWYPMSDGSHAFIKFYISENAREAR